MTIPSYPETTPDGRPYKFLFICGHMRSGTNWVRNLVASHRDVAVYGEGPFGYIWQAICGTTQLPWLYSQQMPEIQPVMNDGFALLIRHCMLYLATLSPKKSWVVDNTSRQLWPYLPGAHHIHIRRDVRDVIVSWTFHQFNHNLIVGEPWKSRMQHLADAFKEDKDHFKKHPHLLLSDEAWVREVAQGWRDYITIAQEVKQKIRDGELDLKLLELSYEHLIADTHGVFQAILDFMDLDKANAFPLSVQNKTLPGFATENPTSHYRSGKVRDWEQYATPEFNRCIKEEVAELLIELGYERDRNW